jgi:hypothetical protein
MEPFTLNRKFLKESIVDNFLSCIWTERYYGDGEVELVVPATTEMIKVLPKGVFLGLNGTNEIMITESLDLSEGNLKVTGISLVQWLNNRFIRISQSHEDRYWYIHGETPGEVLWHIVNKMCVAGSEYLDGTIPIGIPNPQELVIPGLRLHDYDKQGPAINVGVPYGPIYDALKEIATTYQVGMRILLEYANDESFAIGFQSYRGLDRTTNQTVNPPVRFSPTMDSFTNIKELQSIAALKTLVYAFAPGNPGGLSNFLTEPGVSRLTGPQYVGFDLRALMIFAEDLTTDMLDGSNENLTRVLNSRAHDALTTNSFINAVDGEIVPENQYKYGEHYNLGDIIEVQGNTGTVVPARVTEYIRAQDATGEKSYPTVAAIS